MGPLAWILATLYALFWISLCATTVYFVYLMFRILRGAAKRLEG